jgi:hypothetical protein
MKSLFPAPVEAVFPEKSKIRASELLEDINRYLDHYGLEADSLIDMQVKGYLLDYYQNAGLPKSTTPAGFRVLALENPGGTAGSTDIPLLMAYVHGGGRLSDLINISAPLNSVRSNEKAIVEDILENSPQHVIIGKGLIGGPLANRMYLSWVEHLFKAYTPHLESIVERLPDHHRRSATVFVHQMAERLRWTPPDALKPSLTETQRLGLDRNSFSAENYKALVQYAGDAKPALNNYRLLGNVFLTDAFLQLERSSDTTQVVDNLLSKARVTLRTMESPNDEEAMAHQMVACALTAHPEHFKAAGFGLNNLVGFPTEGILDETGAHQRILSGPLAFFMQYEGLNDPDLHRNVLEHCQRLEPDLSIDSIIRHNGLQHSTLLALMMIEKDSYYPALEELVLTKPFPTVRGIGIAHRIHSDGVASRYKPEALWEIYKSYMNDFPLHAPGTDLNVAQEAPYVAPNIAIKFKTAYESVKGFKELVIARLDALEGLTQAHLSATGLDNDNAPQLVQKLGVRDRGRQFVQELGI